MGDTYSSFKLMKGSVSPAFTFGFLKIVFFVCPQHHISRHRHLSIRHCCSQLTKPSVRWIPAGDTVISSLGSLPSTMAAMFLATAADCAAPGRAALCAPESAMSPTA